MRIDKKRITKKIEQGINYLYKDRSFFKNLFGIIVFIMFVGIVKIALIGFDKGKYSGYFEHVVISILLFLFIFQIFSRLKFSGWGNIAYIFLLAGALYFFVFDSYQLMYLASSFSGTLGAGHLLYMMGNYLTKKQKQKQK